MPKKNLKPKGKRPNGEGTFYQREDKSWVHQVTLGRKSDGTPNRKAFTGGTQAECLEKKQAYLKRLEAEETRQAEADARELEALRKGHTLEAEIPLGEAFMPCLKLYQSPPSTKPTTYGSYVETYNTHLCPFFGEMPRHKITTDVVQEYYQTKQKEGGAERR